MNALKFLLKKSSILYLTCSTLVLLWYKKVSAPLDNANRVLFVFSLGVGIAFASLAHDKIIRIKAKPNRVIAACLLFAGIFTVTMLFSNSDIVFLILSGILSGAAFILLQAHGIRNFPFEVRCLSFGLIFACAGALNTLTDITELPLFYLHNQPGNLVMAAAVLLISAVCVFAFMKEHTSLPLKNKKKKNRYLGIAILGVAAVCIVFLAFGVKDSAAYPEQIGDAATSGWLRLIEVPLFIGAGFLCDRIGRQILLIAGLCASLFGCIGMLLPNSPLRWLLETCSLFSILAFSVSICAILGDLSHYAKYPALMISAGFLPLIISQAVTVPISGITNPVTLFLMAFIPCILLIPIVITLLERIRLVYKEAQIKENYSEKQLENVPVKYGLSKRETQVYELILTGMTVTEMSQTLYLTESTVKQHISKILKKTGMESRAKLIKEVNGNL